LSAPASCPTNLSTAESLDHDSTAPTWQIPSERIMNTFSHKEKVSKTFWRGAHLWVLLVAGVALVTPACQKGNLSVLTSVKQIRDLSPEEAEGAYPVHL